MGQVRMTFTAEDAQAVRAFMNVENRQEALRRKQATVAQDSQRMTKRGSQGMAGWARKIAGAATAYFGVSAAMREMRQAYRGMIQRREEAMKSREREFDSMRALGQISRDAEHLAQMSADIEDTMTGWGIDRQAATDLQFLLESIGDTHLREFYADLEAIVPEIDEMAQSVGKVQRALGRDLVGEADAVIDMFLQAGRVSDTTIDEIARGAVRAAGGVKDIGAGIEELLASMAIMGAGEDSMERVATRIVAIGRAAERHDELPTERGLRGVMEAAMEMEQRGVDMTTVFTETRALQGYRLMRDNFMDIAAVTDDIIAARAAAEGTGAAIAGPLARAQVEVLRELFHEQFERRKQEQRLEAARARRGAAPTDVETLLQEFTGVLEGLEAEGEITPVTYHALTRAVGVRRQFLRRDDTAGLLNVIMQELHGDESLQRTVGERLAAARHDIEFAEGEQRTGRVARAAQYLGWAPTDAWHLDMYDADAVREAQEREKRQEQMRERARAMGRLRAEDPARFDRMREMGDRARGGDVEMDNNVPGVEMVHSIILRPSFGGQPRTPAAGGE